MLLWFLTALVAVVLVVGALLLLANFNTWIQARSNHVDVSLVEIFLMKLRKLNSSEIIDSLVTLNRADVEVSVERLQRHALSGGSVYAVTEATVTAKKSQIAASFDDICAMDLAGRDVVSAVNTYVRPRIINCPPSHGGKKEMIIGMAGDGIRLGVQVKITVRVNLHSLIGSAGERTVSARVGEVIIRTIGRSESHKDIMKSPKFISEAIENSAVVAATAYELISVDVLDIEVLDNVGAQLTMARSEADKKVAQAIAEAKRTEAVALRQEMKARAVEMQAELLFSQSRLPSALHASMDEANMGCYKTPVMDVFDWRK